MKVVYVSTKTRLDTAIRNAEERGRQIAYVELLPVEWDELMMELISLKLWSLDWSPFGLLPPPKEARYRDVEIRKVKES